ncbi:hypothetical protein QOL99_16595, partial [Deinococcus sp. MIMF12]|nr:hypothetical protein [Deinococcus rhizophilus]
MTAPPSQADLPSRVAALCAHLRWAHGFRLGPGETAAALAALGAVNLGRRREVRDALRAVLTASREEGRVFDAAFDTFFRRGEAPAPPQLPPLLPRTEAPLPPPPPAPAGQTEDRGPPQPSAAGRAATGEDADTAPTPTRPDPEREAAGDPDAPAPLLHARRSPNAGAGGGVS